jgi:hypothetical protein
MSVNELDQKSMMLGRHESRLDSLEANVQEIGEDVKKILAKLNEQKGSWKTITIFGAMLVSVVEIIELAKDWLMQHLK